MDLRRAFFSRAMRVFHHERVKRLLGDPRAMDVFVTVIRWKERVVRVIGRRSTGTP